MKDYQEYLELHRIGLLNIFDIIKGYLEDKFDLVFESILLDSDFDSKNMHIFFIQNNSIGTKNIDLYLIIYLRPSAVEPYFLLTRYGGSRNGDFNYNMLDIVSLKSLYSKIDRQLLYNLTKFGTNIYFGSKHVKYFSKELSKLTVGVINEAYKI